MDLDLKRAQVHFRFAGELECNPGPGELAVDEGNYAAVACDVNYYGNFRPVIDWYSSDGTRLVAEYRTIENHVG